MLRNSRLSQTGCPATQYQLTALRIQILYSCARTFLEQKSRKALAQSNSRPMGARHELSHLALHSSMLHKVVTLFAAGPLDLWAKATSK